jgi:hypothetical protein
MIQLRSSLETCDLIGIADDPFATQSDKTRQFWCPKKTKLRIEKLALLMQMFTSRAQLDGH